MAAAGKRTLLLVNLASIMERADEALLPAVYKEVGAALHASPVGLGSLTLLRSIVQAACYPLAAFLAVRYNRAHVIALGAVLWALATFLVAISETFDQVAVARAFNGVGLAIVTPAIQSLVADSTDDNMRGSAFGWLQFTGNFGAMAGGLFSLMLASTTIMGIAGWRIAFHVVAILSVLVGILVHQFAVDPLFEHIDGEKRAEMMHKSAWKELKDLVREAKAVIKIPSFQIIVAQGVTGTFPWSALSFVPMWLELMGFSHKGTGALMTTFAISSSLGALIGGKLGDHLAVCYPNAGRIVLAQISSASGIPLAALLLLGLPDDPSTGISHGLVMFIMGLFITWNAPATNNPIFAEVVPKKSRTSIYALDRSFESLLASFAPPIVGLLAVRVYNYTPIIYDGGDSSINTDKANASALAKALYTATAIPMVLCCLIYFLLYRTYPRDKERANMVALATESGMLELGSPSRGMPELTKEITVIDIDYGDEDYEVDDDEKTEILYRIDPGGSVK